METQYGLQMLFFEKKKKKGRGGGPSNPGGLKLFMHFLLNVYTPPHAWMLLYTMNIDAHVYKSM